MEHEVRQISKIGPSYQIVSASSDRLVIRDAGLGGKSVTNGAEEVVRDLIGRGDLKPGMALHYFDSEGNLDGIEWEDRKSPLFYAVTGEGATRVVAGWRIVHQGDRIVADLVVGFAEQIVLTKQKVCFRGNSAPALVIRSMFRMLEAE